MFSPFEWMVAMRYLRARRQEGFISVIAWFSLLGIALGVATLIIVMSVMNGFRQELLSRILGVNGHLSVYGVERSLANYDRLSGQVAEVEGVVKVTPIIEGQVMASANDLATGALVRGLKPEDLRARAILAENIQFGDLENFMGLDSTFNGTPLDNSKSGITDPLEPATLPYLVAQNIVLPFKILELACINFSINAFVIPIALIG